jgi:hypothetical protein
MKKALVLFAFTAFVAANASATYTVVLRDGTRYVAKEKYTIVNGKALIKLESGQMMQVDPALIDVAKSEQITKLGLNANIVDLNTNLPAKPQQQQQSLGNTIKLRQPGAAAKKEEAAAAAAPVPSPLPNTMPGRVLENFERAYDNIGIFERKIAASGPNAIRAELLIDTEERVFNALSATSYLIVKNAGIEGVQIEVVELFMKTTTGGAAGRFRMTRADAEALNSQAISQPDYFVRNVIY